MSCGDKIDTFPPTQCSDPFCRDSREVTKDNLNRAIPFHCTVGIVQRWQGMLTEGTYYGFVGDDMPQDSHSLTSAR